MNSSKPEFTSGTRSFTAWAGKERTAAGQAAQHDRDALGALGAAGRAEELSRVYHRSGHLGLRAAPRHVAPVAAAVQEPRGGARWLRLIRLRAGWRARPAGARRARGRSLGQRPAAWPHWAPNP